MKLCADEFISTDAGNANQSWSSSTLMVQRIRLETKSGRILPLTYATKYDRT